MSAFERLLGPCVQLMKRNIALYEEQLAAVSGPKYSMPATVAEAEQKTTADSQRTAESMEHD